MYPTCLEADGSGLLECHGIITPLVSCWGREVCMHCSPLPHYGLDGLMLFIGH